MKVLLTIEEGFAKTIFEGIDKGAVEWFLKGFQYARNKNLQSPEVIGALNELIRLTDSVDNVYWSTGALSAIENKKGKLEVIE
jgi:hypothetical protein